MNKKVKHTLSVFYYVLVSATTLATIQKNEKCTNPYGINGTCVPLNKCPEVYNAATSKNGIHLLFATKSYCGSDEEVLVCCEHPGPIESPKLDNINSVLGNKECGIAKEQFRIAGGVEAKIGEFPWLAAISYERILANKEKHDLGIRCGGSLINDEFVLTAGYCLIYGDFHPTFVRLGELDTTSDPDCVELVANKFCANPVKIIGIKETIIHPFYNRSTSYNDIGLIRLEEKVLFTDFIAPICLPHPSIPSPKTNERFTIAGWGVWENGVIFDHAVFSDVLLKEVVPILSETECRKHQRSVHRHAFCAGGELLKGACDADNGGPLMKSYSIESNDVWYIQGISSYGVGCGEVGIPTVYVNVSHYIGWILKTIIEYSKVGL